MGNFFRGLVLVMLGFLVGLAAGIMAALQTIDNPDPQISDAPLFGPVMMIGFAIMILGPVLFWVVAPAVALIKHRRKDPA